MNIATKLLIVVFGTVFGFSVAVYLVTNQILTTLAVKRIVTTADTVRNTVSGLIAAGIPLRQFSGFDNVAGPLFVADPGLLRIAILNNSFESLFDSRSAAISGHDTATAVPLPVEWQSQASAVTAFSGTDQSVVATADTIAVALKIRGRLGDTGHVVVMAKQAELADYTSEEVWLMLLALLLTLLFAGVYWIWIADFRISQRRPIRRSFATVYVCAILIIAAAAAAVSADALEDRVSSFVNRLAARFEAAVNLGIAPESLGNLGRILEEARLDDPDHAFTGLIAGARIAFHTETRIEGQRWHPPLTAVTSERQVRARSILQPELRVVAGMSLGNVLQLFWPHILIILAMGLVFGIAGSLTARRWVRRTASADQNSI